MTEMEAAAMVMTAGGFANSIPVNQLEHVMQGAKSLV